MSPDASEQTIRLLGVLAVVGATGSSHQQNYDSLALLSLSERAGRAPQDQSGGVAAQRLERSTETFEAAERVIDRAANVAEIMTALREAERAITDARKAGGSPRERARRITSLERRLEILRDAAKRRLDEIGAQRRITELESASIASQNLMRSRLGVARRILPLGAVDQTNVHITGKLQSDQQGMPSLAGDEDFAELPITDLALVDKESQNSRASTTYRVTLLNGDIGYFKPDDGWQKSYWRASVPPRTEWLREIAAYRFDRLVGLDLVPVTVAREEDLEDKSGHQGMRGSMQAAAPRKAEINVSAYTRIERDAMAVLDYVIGNLDRHGGNYRTFDDGRLAATDHGFAFPTDTRDPIRSSFVKDVIRRPLPAQILDRVRQLSPDTFRRELQMIGIEAAAISGATDRLREIQIHGMITGESWPGALADANMNIFE